jgi:hypothetical protein
LIRSVPARLFVQATTRASWITSSETASYNFLKPVSLFDHCSRSLSETSLGRGPPFSMTSHHRHPLTSSIAIPISKCINQPGENLLHWLVQGLNNLERPQQILQLNFADHQEDSSATTRCWPLQTTDGATLGSNEGTRLVRYKQTPVKLPS